jgi:hypothetical protein
VRFNRSRKVLQNKKNVEKGKNINYFDSENFCVIWKDGTTERYAKFTQI